MSMPAGSTASRCSVVSMVYEFMMVSAQLCPQSERVNLIAGRSDVRDSVRQLRLRHRQGIEAFAQRLDLARFCYQIPSEQEMGRSAGRSGTRMRDILGEGLFRRLNQNPNIVRREREVRIEFEQLLNQCGNLATAPVARLDTERAQERQFEHPVVRKERRCPLRVTDRGEIFH